jgi:hypothetical protein
VNWVRRKKGYFVPIYIRRHSGHILLALASGADQPPVTSPVGQWRGRRTSIRWHAACVGKLPWWSGAATVGARQGNADSNASSREADPAAAAASRHSHARARGHADTGVYPHADAGAHPNANSTAHADPRAHPDANTRRNPHAGADSDAHTGANTDAHTRPNSYTNASAHAHTGTSRIERSGLRQSLRQWSREDDSTAGR